MVTREGASRGKWNKNKCEGYDERDGKRNERYGQKNGTAGVVKMKRTTIKDTKDRGGCNKKKMVEMEMADGRGKTAPEKIKD